MNDKNNPKPLPDDFGMTIPNLRLPKQNQQQSQGNNSGNEADLPTTNLRNTPLPPNKPQSAAAPPPPPPSDDYGMTVPNLRLPKQNPPPHEQQPPPNSDWNLPTTNLRMPNQPPPNQAPPSSNADFGLTMNNYQPNNNYGQEDEFQSTMISYVPAPPKPRQQPHEEEQYQYQQPPPPNAAPVQPQKRSENRGIPAWVWVLLSGFAFIFLIGIGLVLLWVFAPRTGATVVLKGVEPGSTILIDGERHEITAGDGSFTIPGISTAEERRALKVTKPGCNDFDKVIEVKGMDGKTLPPIQVQMRCDGGTKPPTPPTTCKDDPRVCEAEQRALDALDKLPNPFTVDQLVAALNLHIINFDSNSFDVPPERKRFLERAAEKFQQLKGNPRVEIGGHTDNVGNEASNQKLSENRANAVRTLLVNFGVEPKMLATQGFGSKVKKAENDTEQGRFTNRRIEYKVVSR